MKSKIYFNAPVTLGFVGICFCVMIINIITGGKTDSFFVTSHSSLLSPLTYLQFFTHVLGHIDWTHFLNNMVYILLLGPMLEEKYGGKRIAQVIIITALTTGIVNYILFWNVALCGASGICFAFIILSSFTEFKSGQIPLTVIIVVFVFIGQQIYEGVIFEDSVSNTSHIIGGIIGAIVGYLLNKKNIASNKYHIR